MLNKNCLFFIVCLIGFAFQGVSQIAPSIVKEEINYLTPKEYEIADIRFQTKDNSSLDQNILRLLSGLNKGDKIMVPGDRISKAIEALWKQGLFTGVEVQAERLQRVAARGDVFVLAAASHAGAFFAAGRAVVGTDDLGYAVADV